MTDEHAAQAVAAGRAWAEREFEALSAHPRRDWAGRVEWISTESDAAQLVCIASPGEATDDDIQEEREMRELCNAAAAWVFAELVDGAEVES